MVDSTVTAVIALRNNPGAFHTQLALTMLLHLTFALTVMSVAHVACTNVMLVCESMTFTLRLSLRPSRSADTHDPHQELNVARSKSDYSIRQA